MINLKIRFKNPVFYLQLIISLASPILAYMGITASEITSWAKLLDIICHAFSNPYILFLVATSVYNAIIDPTTRGVSDSQRVISYNEPGA